jgi:uncharacterized protein YciI
MRIFAALLITLSLAPPVLAQTPAEVPKSATAKLFAIEITTGPNWDAAKPPPQQAFFREHSAHLKKLRDEGRIKMGARYAEKGLVVIEAADEAEARGLVESDPSMKSGTFKFTLAEMRVFYPGQVGTERKPSP